MKTITLPVILMLFLVTTQMKAQSLSKPILDQLEITEKDMFAATSNGDSEAFKKICGPEYFTINANGVAMTLEEAIPFIPRFKGSTVELSQQKQRVYGNFALRTGFGKVFINSQLVAEFLYSSGWIYRDKRWQFIHWQGTPTGILLEGKGMIEPPKN
ncbi:nuclear transport factor 2 family protein [Flavobacterium sp.]|uniref:nuclear transport factor 2 family protein n=1 Tax=Flavobacterium sp. TaxID=239 RepID=UPI002CF9A9FA|nr:nuclear transport factor 2 family protein [Flavobacterium sp.]HSD09225.1 nuclear transport factor 2 family protein [Flavobacterium sp.]